MKAHVKQATGLHKIAKFAHPGKRATLPKILPYTGKCDRRGKNPATAIDAAARLLPDS